VPASVLLGSNHSNTSAADSKCGVAETEATEVAPSFDRRGAEGLNLETSNIFLNYI
jgi:hypothetical protein